MGLAQVRNGSGARPLQGNPDNAVGWAFKPDWTGYVKKTLLRVHIPFIGTERRETAFPEGPVPACHRLAFCMLEEALK